MPRKRAVEDPNQPRPGEVYVEFRQVGKTMRVVAVDAATGTEVTIMGPASRPQAELQALAVRKLQMQLHKTAE